MKKSRFVFPAVAIAALALSSCSAAPVEVTRVVEVTRIVEKPAAGAPAAAPAATAAPVAAVAAPGGTLKKVLERGKIICGVSGLVPGFSFVDSTGKYSGLDVDVCRAVAAAVYGDASKIEFRNLTTQQRFTALQSGDIDILSRNTTWSLQRDTELGLNFAPVTFYDGQGMMVPKASGITKLEDLKDRTICVQKGTTTELNLADQMGVRKISYKPLSVETADDATAAYEAERCDAYTTDISGLISRRSVLKKPADHIILDVVMSKEPLAPAVRHGDDQWFDIVKWSVYSLFAAEEYGVSSQNAEQLKGSTKDNETRRLLGVEGDMGKKLGLDNAFALNIIKSVGNFGEIYNRNLGPTTPTAIPRGINSLWNKGGLMYSPPIR